MKLAAALLACVVLAWRARVNRLEADRYADLLIRTLREPV